jgi:hypothetical protein
VFVFSLTTGAWTSSGATIERHASANKRQSVASISQSSRLPGRNGDGNEPFDFEHETFAFQNAMVWEYKNGVRVGNSRSKDHYTRRCFVMSRAAMQFHKFARFDPHGAPLDDKELARRIRIVAHREPWQSPLPADQRTVFPGYRNVREMSEKREAVLKGNLGLGVTAYLRIGNARMFFIKGEGYQEKQHANLEAALGRGEMFVAYLSDFPWLHINHSVLVYGKKPKTPGTRIDKYICYDPNHADGPRELKWSPEMRVFNFQKDQEFVGGYTRVYQVYGKAFQ